MNGPSGSSVKPDLFSPLQVGSLRLPNRIVMAPMTRQRADADALPTAIMLTHYVQRAGAGLIISEGIAPEAMGRAHMGMPGLHTDEQLAGWKAITNAVHAAGGRIFAQLMHSGRITYPDILPDRATPIAPSAVRPAGHSRSGGGRHPYVTPRALETAEVRDCIRAYARATARAIAAGFDGVELHAASGYLPMQFLSSGTNLRADAYGGSVQRRCRFVIEALEAMAAEAGAERVGLKISPEMKFNDISDADPAETHTVLLGTIGQLGLAYLHIALFDTATDYLALLRPMFSGPCLAGGGLDRDRAAAMIAGGRADAAVFGTLYVSNPDLERRLLLGAPLTAPDRSTLYTTGPEGYIDYPPLDTFAAGA